MLRGSRLAPLHVRSGEAGAIIKPGNLENSAQPLLSKARPYREKHGCQGKQCSMQDYIALPWTN